MLNAMQSEFITAARSKDWVKTAAVKHAFRIAVLPVVSYSGPMLATADRFLCHREHFSIPGIGVFLVNSSLNRDYTVVVSLSLLYAILLIG